MNSFHIIKRDSKTNARLGVLTTPHGVVKTPSYVMVGTYGHIRNLSPADIKKTGTQIIISNTYHLWDKGLKNKKTKDLVSKSLGLRIPTMTDSGGFQVFSLAFGHEKGAKKIFPDKTTGVKKLKRKNVTVTEKGVYFYQNVSNPPSLKLSPRRSLRRSAGRRARKRFLGPELSMKIQGRLGADIIFAFDELTYLLDNYKYTKKSLERTQRWAKICLKKKPRPDQMLFGITQGGPFKDLRIKGAKFMGSLPFDGFGIGGSFGKEEMIDVLKWTIPHLPDEKPRHLLGVGRVDDIFRAVENGVDLFDCVIPTREARHGRIWTAKGHYDIRKSKYAKANLPLETGCKCPACVKVTKARVYSLFKSGQPVRQAQGRRYALMHNMWFFNNLVEKIRDSIAKDKFTEFKNKTLTNLRV